MNLGLGLQLAENVTATTTEDPAAFGLTGFAGQFVSTLVWVAVGLLLIFIVLFVVDKLTDSMEHNWMNMNDLAGNPTAMAIFAAGLMIAMALIIGLNTAF